MFPLQYFISCFACILFYTKLFFPHGLKPLFSFLNCSLNPSVADILVSGLYADKLLFSVVEVEGKEGELLVTDLLILVKFKCT